MAFREVCQDCTTPRVCGSEGHCCKSWPKERTERKPTSLHVPKSRDKISRMRERIAQARAANPDDPVPGILGAIMDLLEEMTQ